MAELINSEMIETALTVSCEGNLVEWDCCLACVARKYCMRESTLAKIETAVKLLSKKEECVEVYIGRIPLGPDDNPKWPDWLCFIAVPEGYATHRLMFDVEATANIRTARGFFLSMKQKLRQCRPHGRVFGNKPIMN